MHVLFCVCSTKDCKQGFTDVRQELLSLTTSPVLGAVFNAQVIPITQLFSIEAESLVIGGCGVFE